MHNTIEGRPQVGVAEIKRGRSQFLWILLLLRQGKKKNQSETYVMGNVLGVVSERERVTLVGRVVRWRF